MLESCIFGDSAAITAYEAAFADEDNDFTGELLDTLSKQLALIQAAHTANTAQEAALEAKPLNLGASIWNKLILNIIIDSKKWSH